jgi:hypothetical protein
MYTVLSLLAGSWLLIENVYFMIKHRKLLKELGVSTSMNVINSFSAILLSLICILSIFRNHYVEYIYLITVLSMASGIVFTYTSFCFYKLMDTSGTDRAYQSREQTLRMSLVGVAASVTSIFLLLTGDF